MLRLAVGGDLESVEQLLLRLQLLATLPSGFLRQLGIALIVAGSEKGQGLAPCPDYHHRHVSKSRPDPDRKINQRAFSLFGALARLTLMARLRTASGMAATDVSTIAHTIELAVAPVFLLAGIGGILNVVASRLARVVNRMRSLELDIPTAHEEVQRQEIQELAVLDRRIRLCQLSIGLCTASALLISLVVIVLFVAALVTMNFAIVVPLLFIAAMVCLTLGLLLFLAEVTVSTRWVRVSEIYVKRRRPR